MKKWVNGKTVDMTAEEIALLEAEATRQAEMEKHAPPTAEERLAAMESAMIALIGVI